MLLGLVKPFGAFGGLRVRCPEWAAQNLAQERLHFPHGVPRQRQGGAQAQGLVRPLIGQPAKIQETVGKSDGRTAPEQLRGVTLLRCRRRRTCGLSRRHGNPNLPDLSLSGRIWDAVPLLPRPWQPKLH